jgi:hypothetical protein
MTKLKIYQHDDGFKNYKSQYSFMVLQEKQFNILHIMKVLGWKNIYEL